MGILAAPAGLHHHRTADVARRQRNRGRLYVSSLAPATSSHCYVLLVVLAAAAREGRSCFV